VIVHIILHIVEHEGSEVKEVWKSKKYADYRCGEFNKTLLPHYEEHYEVQDFLVQSIIPDICPLCFKKLSEPQKIEVETYPYGSVYAKLRREKWVVRICEPCGFTRRVDIPEPQRMPC